MVEVLTFGCRLNAVESEAIRGFGADLDAVVVNTCAVTLAAEREARQAVARVRRERPGTPIIVTGCAAQIDPSRWAALPGVTRVVGNREKLDRGAWAGDWAGAWAGAGAEGVAAGPIGAARGHVPAAPAAMAGRARAFLDVQQGCDHRCTFCIIPAGRGAARSAPAEVVGARLREMAAAGANEVVLTGVDLASWGCDLPGRPTLAALLRAALRAAPELARVRLSSLDPAALDAAFWDVFAGEERLMPHLHLSVQAADDMVLKRMRRRHARDEALEVVARARRARPGAGVAADLIAGFPTETEAMFQRTLGFVDEAQLPYVHVFPYSARPGTPAAQMPQVPAGERRARAAALRQAAAGQALRFHAGLVGQERAVVVERGGRGHTPEFAPVRGVAGEVGQVVRVRARAADSDGLEV